MRLKLLDISDEDREQITRAAQALENAQRQINALGTAMDALELIDRFGGTTGGWAHDALLQIRAEIIDRFNPPGREPEAVFDRRCEMAQDARDDAWERALGEGRH